MYRVVDKFQEGMRFVFRVNTPTALTMEGWDDYTKLFKADRPIAYFFTETISDFLYGVILRFDLFFRATHCWFARYDLIRTGLAKTKYHEADNLLLHGMFSVLVDFVEVELASYYCATLSKEERKQYNVPRRHFLWTNWRSPEAGMKELERMVAEVAPDGDNLGEHYARQARSAKEILELYTWWKNVRPNRKDPYAEYDEYRKDNPFPQKNDGKNDAIHQIFERVDMLEEDYENEDTQMSIRLVKIRRELWT